VDELAAAQRPVQAQPLPESRGSRPQRSGSPLVHWPPWTAPAALASGLVVAVVGGLLVDIPALALGVNVTAHHIPDGLQIADTVVQDAGFVLVAIFFAQLGGRAVKAWQFGLRPTPFWRAVGTTAAIGIGFLLCLAVWNALVHPPTEKVLEQIGTGVFSAALTCVVAPICEEFLFRGFIFTALRNWRGTWPAAVITALLFGAVHVGSAPALDLVPLAGLGFALCLLYRRTGSLYPCIVVHSVNNSVAFGTLAKWSWEWQIPALVLSSLAVIGALALALTRVGVIAAEGPLATPTSVTVTPDG
jgi:membrane protease YdiL (CAAX protease family)